MPRVPWPRMAGDEGFEDWFVYLTRLRRGKGLEIESARIPVPTAVRASVQMRDEIHADSSRLADSVREILSHLHSDDQRMGQLTWALLGTSETPLTTQDQKIFWRGRGWTERQEDATAQSEYPADIRTIRDRSDEVVYRVAKVLWQSTPQPKPESALLREYLREVIARNNVLLVGDANRSSIAPELVSAGNHMTLSSVWTSLRVALQPASDHESSVESKTDKLEVLDALQREEFRQVVLLGNPGAGKSSVVARQAVSIAEDALDESDLGQVVVPVHVRLGDLEVGKPPRLSDLWSGVRERTADLPDAEQLQHFLEPYLTTGRALTFFDGLDEVQEEALGGVMEILHLFREKYPEHRFVVTCRAFDYALPEPNRKLPLPPLYLLPFELDQQLAYLDNWYQLLAEISPGLADEDRKQSLKDSLSDSKDLQKIGGTPLHLALMAVVHTNKGELPENRALLYYEIVQYLLAESPEWRAKNSQGRVNQGPQGGLAELEDIMLAGRVGYEVHRQQELATGEFRGLPIKDLLGIVQEHFGLFQLPYGTIQYKALEQIVGAQVERLVQSNGLLVDQGKQVYNFAFKQCREFLAGVHLSSSLGEDEEVLLAQKPHWREPFRLLASWAAPLQPNIDYVLSFVDDLGDFQREGFRTEDPILAGEMLVEVGRERLARRPKLLTPTTRSRGLDGLWPRMIDRIRPLIEDLKLPTNSRIRAADVLAELGDPRFVDSQRNLTPLESRLIALPPTRLVIGATEMEHPALHRPVNSEPRALSFRSFRIGRYAVTNCEYAEFQRSGGYSDPRWWPSAEAKAWLRGDQDFITELERSWLQTAEYDYEPELKDGTYTLDSLAETARELSRSRNAPYFSEHSRFNGATQPVVGVNFWEAQAFCYWSTQRGLEEGWLGNDEEVRLPSEWEWERAARHVNPDGVYPWGDDWSPDEAHTKLDASDLFRASPVGCFRPAGPDVPAELAGNVWEWTGSRLLSYEPEFDGQREQRDGLVPRAMRGSSWYDNEPIPNTRSSARCVDLPGNVYKDAGFRVVVDKRGSLAYLF